MKITEKHLRNLTRNIIAELLTKKSGINLEKFFGGGVDIDPNRDYIGDDGGYGGGFDDGGFGESDEKVEEDKEEEE